MTIEVGSKILDALRILQTLEIRHLPVVDPRGLLLGMISDRDLRNARIPYMLAEEVGPEFRSIVDQPITAVMTAEPEHVTPASSIAEVIDLLLELNIGAMPVVDDTSRELVGIVSYVDVLRAARRSID